MTFNILDRMVGLSVLNAVDGNVIGVSTRLIFDKKHLEFKYVLVESEDENKRLLYLRYPDILRMNDRAILCLTDENSFVNNYVFYDDPDAFVFVGDDAVDEGGSLIGVIESAELDEDAKIVSFTVRKGRSRIVFPIDRLLEITHNGVIIVHRTPEDVFIEEEPPKKGSKKKEPVIEAKAEEISPVAPPVSEKVDPAPVAAAVETKPELKLSAPELPDEKKPETINEVTLPKKEEPKKEGLDIEWGSSSESSSQSSYDEEEAPEGKKKKKEKEPKVAASSGLVASLQGVFRNMDAVSGLRYALLVVFFVVCVVLGGGSTPAADPPALP